MERSRWVYKQESNNNVKASLYNLIPEELILLPLLFLFFSMLPSGFLVGYSSSFSAHPIEPVPLYRTQFGFPKLCLDRGIQILFERH